MDDDTFLGVMHHSDVLVTPLERDLVDSGVRRKLGLSSCQPPPHRPAHDARGLRPSQTELTCHGREACLLEPVDDQGFEQGREPRARLPPGHAHLPHPVLRAIHAGHLRHQDRAELTGIQVPPTPRPGVVTRRQRPTLRALQTLPCTMRQQNPDLPFVPIQLHIRDRPRLLDPQDLAVKLLVSHAKSISWPESRRYTHTRYGRALFLRHQPDVRADGCCSRGA